MLHQSIICTKGVEHEYVDTPQADCGSNMRDCACLFSIPSETNEKLNAYVQVDLQTKRSIMTRFLSSTFPLLDQQPCGLCTQTNVQDPGGDFFILAALLDIRCTHSLVYKLSKNKAESRQSDASTNQIFADLRKCSRTPSFSLTKQIQRTR